LSEGKVGSYTIVPQKNVLQEFLDDIERKYQKDLRLREQLFQQQLIRLKEYVPIDDEMPDIVKEIEDFHNITGSVLDETMTALVEQFVRSNELSASTALALSIKTKITEQYVLIGDEQGQAKKLYQKLRSLGAENDYSLLQTLLLVQEGKARLDHRMEKEIEEKISDIEDEAVKKASKILIAGLEELGYEVNGIEETLFVDGGEFYFRNEDGPQVWDPHYYVRGKVNPKNNKVTFLMGYEGKTLHSKEQDYRVEEQFCSELGTLQKSLEQNNVSILIEELIMPGEGGLIEIASGAISKKS
jgi:hypothetical protein